MGGIFSGGGASISGSGFFSACASFCGALLGRRFSGGTGSSTVGSPAGSLIFLDRFEAQVDLVDSRLP